MTIHSPPSSLPACCVTCSTPCCGLSDFSAERACPRTWFHQACQHVAAGALMTTRTLVGPEHDDQRVNQFLVERPLCARSRRSLANKAFLDLYDVRKRASAAIAVKKCVLGDGDDCGEFRYETNRRVSIRCKGALTLRLIWIERCRRVRRDDGVVLGPACQR